MLLEGTQVRGRHDSQGDQLTWKGVHCCQRHSPRCQASSTPDAGLPASFFTKAGSSASKRPQPPGTASGEGLRGRQAQTMGLYVSPEYMDLIGNDEVGAKWV